MGSSYPRFDTEYGARRLSYTVGEAELEDAREFITAYATSLDAATARRLAEECARIERSHDRSVGGPDGFELS